MTKIYIASSWRNEHYDGVRGMIEQAGYEVHDWRNAATAFRWDAIDPDYRTWTPDQYTEALNHPLAKTGFRNDHEGMIASDICGLLLPSGRSAHVEAGYMGGRGK